MIRAVLNLYILLIVADTILSYVPQFKSTPWAQNLKKVADFTLAPVRKALPNDLPFDVSPIIVILAIKLVEALW